MRKPKAIRVVLADDHAMVRQGLAQMLEDDANITVIGQADNGDDAVSVTKALKPDVAVLDYSMPLTDGATAAKKILRSCPRTRIVILTVHDNVHYAMKSLEAGACGFVLKSAVVQELIQCIRTVHAGGFYVSPVVSDKMMVSLSGGQSHLGVNELSPREFELVRLLGSGRRLQDCAKLMHISESAASTYRARLLKKLKLTCTAELIRFALENGIVG